MPNKIFSIFLACMLIINLSMPSAVAIQKTGKNDLLDAELNSQNAVADNTLEFILPSTSYSNAVNVQENFALNGTEVIAGSVMFDENSSCEYIVNITKSGNYTLYVEYALPSTNTENVEFLAFIDGKDLFGDRKPELIRHWQDSISGIRVDSFGNEYAPEQVVYTGYRGLNVYDTSDVDCKKYQFELSKGEHILKISDFSDKAVISRIGFVEIKEPLNYNELEEIYAKNNIPKAKGDALCYEGESACLKTAISLVSKSDNGSATIFPSDPIKQKINYIGGANWKNPGEKIIWKIVIPESGLYKLGFCFKQDQNINSVSYRRLEIDGIETFSESGSIEFNYGTNWQNVIIGNDEDYLFYLEKGVHEISLTATLGASASYYDMLNSVIQKIGDMYVDITMITGESPDANRDYELFNNIPQFNERLTNMSNELSKVADGMLKLSDNEVTSFISSIKDMIRILNSMVKEKYSAQNYVSNYSTCYTTLSNWLYDMRSMPVSIDRFYIIPADSDFEFEKTSFGEKLFFGLKRFIAAFGDDYNRLNDISEEEEHLKIWVNWGRDQTMVLNTLISESFTPETNINVNLEITNASLLYGILSGNAPDLSLHMARTEPVNLAMRGALVDLSEFKDYGEVVKRFGKSASVPYEYGDGVYALPDQQSFYLMFYRKDILDNLGIPVPETWDEFLDAVSVLQRNNMNAWIPYTQITAASTVNTGVGGLNLYASILQQFGGDFYNDDLNECIINSEIGLNAFTYWTDMYTKYNLPTTTSFYNRFRMGTMPLGIEPYTLYTTLSEAAPDIEGRWGIALVPGIKDKNGNINHTVSGSGTGCAIINSSKHKEEAWEFLKWWTEPDTQLKYNNNVEAILGTISRTTTATLETFERMSWKEDDLNILLEQREWIEEIPEVPGSYYVSRSVDQAFWNVINNAKRPKDVLDKWGEIATAEIERKIAEYSE